MLNWGFFAKFLYCKMCMEILKCQYSCPGKHSDFFFFSGFPTSLFSVSVIYLQNTLKSWFISDNHHSSGNYSFIILSEGEVSGSLISQYTTLIFSGAEIIDQFYLHIQEFKVDGSEKYGAVLFCSVLKGKDNFCKIFFFFNFTMLLPFSIS